MIVVKRAFSHWSFWAYALVDLDTAVSYTA